MSVASAYPRWRVALGGLAAALALTFLVGTPEGQGAAAAFLAQFRSQRFAVVTMDPSQARRPLAELEHLGTLKNGTPSKSAEEVRDVAEASRRVGFDVKQPSTSTLPAGLSKQPRVLVTPAQEIRFTFDRARAQAYYAQQGKAGLSLPERFDGASLIINAPAAALLRYEGASAESGLLIGQSRQVTGGVEGKVSLEEMRDFLLGLPGLQPETVRQLKAIQDWKNTLPIPVPADRVNWKETTIAGGQGLLLADSTGIASAAIWERDGRVYGIAGSFKADDVQRVANSLK